MAPDRISFLPCHVIDQILSHLPIREAVRTSVLSRKWRYKWATLPDLVFNDQCVSIASQDNSVITDKLARTIDHVLLLHSGPINMFKLSHSALTGVSDIDRWALHLSRRSVNVFVLEIWEGEYYRIPSSLFACQSLVNLELYNCWVKPPSTFRGFRNLKSLDLQHVTLAQGAFENLTSGCPLLERLILLKSHGFTHLKIHAPNLRYFEIDGTFEGISFKNTFNLVVVSIRLDLSIEDIGRISSGSSSNLLKFFARIPHVRRLLIEKFFLKYLAVGILPLKLPNSCVDLNYLSICLNFHDSKEISAILCLLRSSPNLQELRIVADRGLLIARGVHTYRWEDDYWSCPFTQLRLVRIDGITGSKPELDFIRFLLIDSPVLERMTVKPAVNGGVELMKELLQSRRASRRAEIIYMES